MRDVNRNQLRECTAVKILVGAIGAWLLVSGIAVSEERSDVLRAGTAEGHHAGEAGLAGGIREPEGTLPGSSRSPLHEGRRSGAPGKKARAGLDRYLRLLWRHRGEGSEGDSGCVRAATLRAFSGGNPHARRSHGRARREGPS